MGEIEDTAVKIVNAFEDSYFDKEKRAVFTALFDRFLAAIDLDDPDPYEVIVQLGYRYRFEYDQLVQALKDRGLLTG